MSENKFLNENPEQVVIIPKPRIIRINNAHAYRAYGLFDSETGTQVSDFVKGTNGNVEFKDLEPNRHYDVGTIENPGDEKPQYAMIWNQRMKDDRDAILNNSDNLPIVYPKIYSIKDDDNSNNVFDLVDDKGETVGQVMNLLQTGDKPKFMYAHTFRMKDDTVE